MNYTGNIPTNKEEAMRAKSVLKAFKKERKHVKTKTWHSNDLFYEEVSFSDLAPFQDKHGLVYENALPVQKTVIKKVPYFSLEVSADIKKKDVIDIFKRKYGFDKYKTK